MGRPAKGPRLCFDGKRGSWIIRHGTAFIRVGGDRAQAEAQLQRYMSLRALDAPRKCSAPFLGMVYFITAAHPGYPIKIGFTESMKAMRLSQLQTACPYSLYLIGMVR